MKNSILICLTMALCCCHEVKNEYQNFDKLLGYNVSYWANDFGELCDGKIVGVEKIFPAAIYAFAYCGVFVETSLEDSEYHFNETLLRKNELYTSYLYDSCNFFITEEKNGTCANTNFPIPDYWNGVKGPFSRQQYPLDSLSQFIVVETGEGLHLDEKFLKGLNLDILINHGFSSGVVLNPTFNSITYWTIVW